MKTTSVSTYATADVESFAVTDTTPYDIVAALEESFNRPLLTAVSQATRADIIKAGSLCQVVTEDPVMGFMAERMAEFREQRKLADARWQQKQMLFRNFGKWLPDHEKAMLAQAKEGLDSIEDRLAAACYATERIKSFRKWKSEQDAHQDVKRYDAPVMTKKSLVDGRLQWCDATVHDLPPRIKGKAHAPAYYAIKLPDGRVVSLGSTQGEFAPVKHKYPSHALQAIAKRLGIEMRGGDTAIINALLNEPQIEFENEQGQIEKAWKYLASYTTVWQGAWIIYVGWRLNPKVAPSGYWVDEFGELTRQPQGEDAPLTLTQLDYHLLSEGSDLEVKDESGEVVDYMNPEEEFLTLCPQREAEAAFIDFSAYAEDDDELELFQSCSAVIDRSEGGITEGDLESQQYVDGYLHKGIMRADRALCKLLCLPPNPEIDAIVANLRAHLDKLNKLDAMWNKFVGNSKTDHLVSYWYPNESKRMLCMSRPDHAKMLPPDIAGSSDAPDNTIEAPIEREVDAMPEHESWQPTWLTAISPKLMAKRERANRKAQVLQAVSDGTLGVQLAFSKAFDMALGLR